MRQIVTIHGGDAFASYEEYFEFLKKFEVDDPATQSRGWRSLLGERLGPDYQIISPRMPNAYNAKYAEWKLWFEKYFKFLNDDVILLGHSLGACFLAKYLAENKFPKRIKATFLVSGPFDTDGDRKLIEFDPPQSLELLAAQGGKIFLYHSKDDSVVNYGELAKYEKLLPEATARLLDGRNHFEGDEFPELLADIRSLS